ncbi:MAG: C25 family cysteine peptidase [Bacteroidota bacterium]
MRLLSIIILIVFKSFYSFSQPYGNEWIDYSQQYYKIKIIQEGVYRISYAKLNSIGVPVSSFDPRSFQIFSNGKEVPIYVKGENDGIFNTSDYIEFYATKNTGYIDSAVYDTPSSQANPNYSLFNDTAAYFLTWNSSSPLPNGNSGNFRFQPENDINFTLYSPSLYFIRKIRQDYISRYYYGETNPITDATDPEYTAGEGWFDDLFGLQGSVSNTATKSMNTTNLYSGGPNAEIDIMVIGASNYASLSPDHHLRIQFNSQTIDTLFEGYGNFRFNRSITPSLLTNGSTSFSFTSLYDWGSSPNPGYMAVSYINIIYPHSLDLENAQNYKFYIPNTTETKSFLTLTNVNASANDSVFVYDFANKKRIPASKAGSNLKVLVENNGGLKECFLFTESSIKNVSTITPVNSSASNFAKFTNYNLNSYKQKNYIIISHSSLMNDVASYQVYRNQSGYNVLVADVEELYNQFAFGIGKHPLAIRNFCNFAVHTFDSVPKHLFLIGKAYKPEKYRNNTALYAGTLVPSYGNPPSDILFTAGLNDIYYKPAIATGRLSAKTPYHVYLYKNKVVEYEQAQQNPQEWMKRILHFGGGSNLQQQNQLSGYLNVYETLIEDTLFGGVVTKFLKSSTSPIQITTSDSLRDLMNTGVSMLTFFGHGAGIGFDQSIDHPSEYSNQGKYPFLLANSCLAGDIFDEATSSSEEFVLIENKGVIGYLASVTKSQASPLHIYSTELHRNIAYKLYGSSIGTQIQAAIKAIQSPSQNIKDACLEMTLHGDPAIKINYSALPDYEVKASGVYTTPTSVSPESDPFVLNIISTNLGRVVCDSFIVEVIRTFPDGSTYETYLKKVKATFFKDTIRLSIPVDIINGIGLNKFKISLDAYNGIPELTELNNVVEVDIFIKSNDIIPIYPYKYAIVPDQIITLKASTGNPFAPIRNYRFELDTTDSFNSPFLKTAIISAPGGVVSWTPSITMTDSTVYYWRVAVDSIVLGNYNWRESSYQYILNKTGWGQAHFFQFKNDDYQYVSYKKSSRKFDFVNNVKSVYVQTGVYPNIQWDQVKAELNGYLVAFYNCAYNGILFVVLDSISANYWVSQNQGNNTGQYGNYHCKSYDLNYFDYYTSGASNRQKIVDFVKNNIPNGNYVIAYSHENSFIQNDTLLYQSFESFGSSLIRSIPNNRPFIVYGKKGGAIGTAHEVVGPATSSIIQLQDSVKTRWNEGYIQSELIGPSAHWGSLHWRNHNAEGTPSDYDSIRLSVIGIKANGAVDTVISNLAPTAANQDILNLYDYIDAAEYPYLKLIAFMRDDTLRTPSQLKRWQVIYDGMPETALNPAIHYQFNSPVLNEGQEVSMSIATQNISDYDMDSLLISYWIVDNERVAHPKVYHRRAAHPSGNVLIDTVKFSTYGLPGLNSMWVEVNPINPTTTVYDQLEQYHFNNIAQIDFNINADKINPILDVTYDGIRILDGDIVSAKPKIEIRLKDENHYLPLNDTSIFKVFLQYPKEYTARRVYFNDNGIEKMQFFPVTGNENICKIEYNPIFPDGIYQLIVQARDISSNQSGDVDYKVSFEVVNKPAITNMMNWPNPFSTKTHFVFTLTGYEIPQYMKIQIMTITGKVVREIDITELGNVHIGRNITEYAWDGKDEFGDQLANGVYFYRVITKLNGTEMEIKTSGADAYLKNDFGKMFLMR